MCFVLKLYLQSHVYQSQVSVFSPSVRKHYLNITPDNIIRIYSPQSDNLSRQPLVNCWVHVLKQMLSTYPLSVQSNLLVCLSKKHILRHTELADYLVGGSCSFFFPIAVGPEDCVHVCTVL